MGAELIDREQRFTLHASKWYHRYQRQEGKQEEGQRPQVRSNDQFLLHDAAIVEPAMTGEAGGLS
jgi:hypothetical protein